MQTTIQKRKGEILADAIISRKFDIPGYMYDLIDEYTVDAVLNRYDKDSCLKMFLTNQSFYGFCEYVKDLVDFKKYIFFNVIQTHSIWKGLFIFSEADWARLESYSYSVRVHGDSIEELNGAPGADETNPFTKDEVIGAIYTTLMNPELHDQFEFIYRFAYTKLEDVLDKFVGDVPARYLVNALSYLSVENKFSRVLSCIDRGIPILYKDYDCVDLHMYLSMVIETVYTGKLDPALADINSFIENNKAYLETDEILRMLWYIGTNLNQNNLKYYYIATGEPASNTGAIINALENTDAHVIMKWGYLKNFQDLIIMLGHNSAGFSIELQKLFLTNGGDITTMFNKECRLLPEASIIKTTDMIPFLFQIASDDDLRYLLEFSPEFIKNLMTSTWITHDHLLKVLDILFTIPVDEELWRAMYLPNNEDEFTDYRASIINRIVTTLSKDLVIAAIPKSVAYIDPTIVFVSKNLTEEYISFFPVTKIAPMLKSIISRSDYIPFNLFCNGTMTSITKAVGDTQFIIDTLVQDKKYGYLCDMEGEDVEQIINTIAEHMETE